MCLWIFTFCLTLVIYGEIVYADDVMTGTAHLNENLAETDQPPSKTPISNQYSLAAPQP